MRLPRSKQPLFTKNWRKTRETRRSLTKIRQPGHFGPQRQAEKSQACTDRPGKSAETPAADADGDDVPLSRCSAGVSRKGRNEKLANISHRAWFHVPLLQWFVMASVERAQQIPESLYSEMKWRMIGPFRAGKVNAVAGVPGNPASTIWRRMAAVVWKTTDGGTVWKPIFDKEPVASIERWRWRRRIRKSFTWERVSTRFCRQQLWRWNLQIRGWRREMAACGVGGPRGTSENPDRSTESGRRAGCGEWGHSSDRTKSEAFFARRMAGGRGKKFCTKTM